MDDFQKRYKSFDNQKLLKIVETAENYLPSAVEAAKLELSKRNISDNEIQAVKNEILDKKTKIKVRQKQIKKVENKAKSIGSELFNTVNIVQEEPYSTQRKINLIVIVFGLLAAFRLLRDLIFQDFSNLKYVFSLRLVEWDFNIILYLIIFILLPIAVFLFWKKNKHGWIMMTAFFIHSTFSALHSAYVSWKWNSRTTALDSPDSNFLIEFIDNEFLLPQPHFSQYLFIAAFFCANIWVNSRPDIRNVFDVDLRNASIVIGVSILFSLLNIGFC